MDLSAASSTPTSTSITKPLRQSKILAALDAELPDWLGGPLAPNVAGLVASSRWVCISFCVGMQWLILLRHSSHQSITMGQWISRPNAEVSEPTATMGSIKPSSKGKARATVAELHRTPSDIENNPVIAEDDIETSPPVTSKPASKTKAQSKTKFNLPLYSYKQYRPVPAVVYTQHEEEANDLVQGMKGPLGFDLEWVVTFRRGKTPMERRTALVQLCDAQMILLVQVSAMKSTFHYIPSFDTF